jgi:hypothetical protein
MTQQANLQKTPQATVKANTQNTRKITLPLTGETAVAGYTVTISQTWEAREGLGFNGRLKRGTNVVGEVCQDGNGGMTDVRFTSKDEEKAFDEYVGLWDFTWGAEFGTPFPHNSESVIDTLAMESVETRILNRSKKLHIRKARDGKMYTAAFPIAKGDTTLPSALLKQLETGDQFWNKEQWVTV